jgi:hypothetical protein
MVRKISLIIILIALSTAGYTQVIKGTILDLNTHARINFASVYFNGTFVGTHTDQKGYFELDISRYRSMPLTISALGYYSITIADLQSEKPFLIYLAPKIYELNEVVIKAKGNYLARKTYFNIFKREFLGTTVNALSCRIINEDDISVKYDPVSDTLTAFCMNPILIRNKNLGYDITYYLDKFEISWSTYYVLMIGNYIFKEDSTNNSNEQKRCERRRESAFLGSRMHFFRALWENNLDSAGFTVKDTSNVKLSYENLVVQTTGSNDDDNLKYLKYHGSLYIAYQAKLPQSRIRMLKDSVCFDKNGFFDPLGISWQGELAKQRTGDLLPFEYRIK